MPQNLLNYKDLAPISRCNHLFVCSSFLAQGVLHFNKSSPRIHESRSFGIDLTVPCGIHNALAYLDDLHRPHEVRNMPA